MLECSSAQQSRKADTNSSQRHRGVVPKNPDWLGPDLFEGLQVDLSQLELCNSCHHLECMLHFTSADQLLSGGRHQTVSLLALHVIAMHAQSLLEGPVHLCLGCLGHMQGKEVS